MHINISIQKQPVKKSVYFLMLQLLIVMSKLPVGVRI